MKQERVNIKFHKGVDVPKSWKTLQDLDDEVNLHQIGVKSYRVPPGQAKKIAAKLKGHEFIKDIEEDGEGSGLSVESDSLLFGSEWFQQQVRMPAAWMEISNGTFNEPKIGICDSGLFKANPWIASQADVGGEANFVANETTTSDNEGHGTACSGLICSTMPFFKLYNARVMSQNSAKWSAVAQGIIWCVDQGCQVVSCSICGPSNGFVLIDAMMYAVNHGCVVVCAAGNYGNDTNQYPAATANAVAIAATDKSDARCSFSNYGTHIQLAAPGTDLLTAWGGGYNRFSGTSGSTPIVAGILGLVIAKGSADGIQALAKVKETAKNLNNALYFGAGRVDAAAAVGLPAESAPPPSPPPSTEPPPPMNDTVDIGKEFQWTSAGSNTAGWYGKAEGIDQLHDGTVNTKCLWKQSMATVTLTATDLKRLDEIQLAVANDTLTYPGRHPKKIEIWADDQFIETVFPPVPTSNSSWQPQIPLTNPAVAKKFDLVLYATSGTIIQVAEVAVYGSASATTTQPPTQVELPINILADLADIDTFIVDAVAAEKDLLRTELLSLINKLG